mmetsp:Transcript_622/g.1296  ORF Transcript_622/g.1296 Transcript_622/m.1296 type:complete len:228 (+) Transcript_622:640-1323(+)
MDIGWLLRLLHGHRCVVECVRRLCGGLCYCRRGHGHGLHHRRGRLHLSEPSQLLRAADAAGGEDHPCAAGGPHVHLLSGAAHDDPLDDPLLPGGLLCDVDLPGDALRLRNRLYLGLCGPNVSHLHVAGPELCPAHPILRRSHGIWPLALPGDGRGSRLACVLRRPLKHGRPGLEVHLPLLYSDRDFRNCQHCGSCVRGHGSSVFKGRPPADGSSGGHEPEGTLGLAG